MTTTTASLIAYLISFCLGVYVAIAVFFFRRTFQSIGLFNVPQAVVAIGRSCLWPVYAFARRVPVSEPSAHAQDPVPAFSTHAQDPVPEPSARAQDQPLGYERIQNVEDTDELYRLCLEFLQSQAIGLGVHASHVPYAEMLRQSVVTARADGPRMLHMLGLIALSRYDLKTTRRLLDRAVRADPNDAEIHNSLGYTLCQEQKFLAASIVLMRAATLRPDLAVAEVNLNLARVGLSGGAA